MKRPLLSETHAAAGETAKSFTILALLWNTIAFRTLISVGPSGFLFKTLFIAPGFFLILVAAIEWYRRLKGGGASMQLPIDPVPHGVPVMVKFVMTKQIQPKTWHVEAKIMSRSLNHSGLGGPIWVQNFPAQVIDKYRVLAKVTLPSDYPATTASDDDMLYWATLTLKANGIAWTFDLCTQNAGNAVPQQPPPA